MEIQFSGHALSQVKERKIAKEKIIKTVEKPLRKIKSFRNRELRQRVFGSKILEVVIVAEGSIITVVTAYYLDLKEKYEN